VSNILVARCEQAPARRTASLEVASVKSEPSLEHQLWTRLIPLLCGGIEP
jgi:hypothetical protein